VEETNAEFGGLDNRGKRIYFFNAIEDPWQYAGMRNITDPEKHPDQKAWLIDCENCAHCVDLKTPTDSDADSLKNGREDAYKQLDAWYNSTDSYDFAGEEVKKDMILI